jgi:hypothetical protein
VLFHSEFQNKTECSFQPEEESFARTHMELVTTLKFKIETAIPKNRCELFFSDVVLCLSGLNSRGAVAVKIYSIFHI